MRSELQIDIGDVPNHFNGEIILPIEQTQRYAQGHQYHGHITSHHACEQLPSKSKLTHKPKTPKASHTSCIAHATVLELEFETE